MLNHIKITHIKCHQQDLLHTIVQQQFIQQVNIQILVAAFHQVIINLHKKNITGAKYNI